MQSPPDPDVARLREFARRADWGARIASIATFVLAMGLFMATPFPDQGSPAEVTTSVGSEVVIIEGSATPGTSTKETTSESTKDSNAGPIAAAFDNAAGVFLLRLGLAAFAAFVAGAFVQRVVLARFAIKVGAGGLELADLSESSQVIAERVAKLEEVAEKHRMALEEMAKTLPQP